MPDGPKILLTTPRPWMGNQKLGAFVVSLDGAKAGILMPQGSLEVACAPGPHRVRARQWYYNSPTFEVDVAPGEVVRLRVDLVRRDSLLKRSLALMFTPWRGVAITQVDG